jgi:hypothetical protein
MHQRKPGRIPQFVHKMTVSLDPFFRHFDVPTLGGKSRQRKTESIGAILLDYR